VRQLAFAIGAAGRLSLSQQFAGRLIHDLPLLVLGLRLASIASSLAITRAFLGVANFMHFLLFFNLEG
jgi:hypothetical protein